MAGEPWGVWFEEAAKILWTKVMLGFASVSILAFFGYIYEIVAVNYQVAVPTKS